MNKIKDIYNKQKTSVVALITSDNMILLQKAEHQGGIVFDMYGTFLDMDSDAKQTIEKEVLSQLGVSIAMSDFGVIIDYINKPEPDGRVKLITRVFKSELSGAVKNKLALKDNQFWMDYDKIDSSNTIRYIDKLIMKRAFHVAPMNVIAEEDQYERWIDARLIEWSEVHA